MDITAIAANIRLRKTKIGCLFLVDIIIEIIADKTVIGIVTKNIPKNKKISMYTQAARTAVIHVHIYVFFNILLPPFILFNKIIIYFCYFFIIFSKNNRLLWKINFPPKRRI